MTNPPGRKNRRPLAGFALVATGAAFAAYFCMYAFRRGFTAGTYSDVDFELPLLGQVVGGKTLFVIAQIIGYCLSKYVGTKVCAEVRYSRLAPMMAGLVLASWLALLLFALAPPPLRPVAIFASALPLGMVWGLVIRFLEGRETSDLLLVGLSCSYILAGGEVRRTGRWLIDHHGVSEFWMPFVTGALYLCPFLLAVWILSRLPRPSEADRRPRGERVPMARADRWRFLRRFLPGMLMLCLAYVLLTAYRDFRDVYQTEIFLAMDIDDHAAFTRTERPVAVGVVAALGLLFLIRDNRAGLTATYAVMVGGLALLWGSTWMFERDRIGGETWMLLTGLGIYLAYVPFGTLLFERTFAYTRYAGTAVFAIYVADAIGYTGTVALQIYKDLLAGGRDELGFFIDFTKVVALAGVPLLACALIYFRRKGGSGDPTGH